MSQTSEKAFETHVEEILIGQCGWTRGNVAKWLKYRVYESQGTI